MSESRLFDEGCRLCGSDRAGFTLLKMYGRANHGANLCAGHGGSDELRAAADREITRRLSLRSAPAPESATGEGEFYGTCPPPDQLPESLPAGTRAVVPGYDLTGYALTGCYYYGRHAGMSHSASLEWIDWTTVRKSPPPPEARDLSESSRSVSADSKPKAVGVSDPCCSECGKSFTRGDRGRCAYCHRRGKFLEAGIAEDRDKRDAAYRSRVAALTLDFDRPLPRTWRDRMGRLVGFDGPVGKGGRGA